MLKMLFYFYFFGLQVGLRPLLVYTKRFLGESFFAIRKFSELGLTRIGSGILTL